MNFLIDTNVISEWTKPRPDAGVIRWLDEADEDRMFLSVVTLAEIHRGICLLPAGRKRESLKAWAMTDLPDRFEGRLLAIVPAIAEAWGQISATRTLAGGMPKPMDGFIAATAIVHGLAIVTRSTRDFRDLGLELIDPWV